VVLISYSTRLGCGFLIVNENPQGVQKVIVYGSRKWSKHESVWSVTELEMAGTVYALESHNISWKISLVKFIQIASARLGFRPSNTVRASYTDGV